MTVTMPGLETMEALAAFKGDLPMPGSWKDALYRADAPGAALDGQPWARSWGAFMRAVTDAGDSSAREFIGQVMDRPVNAGFSERHPEQGGFLVPEYLRSQVLAYMTGAIVRPRAMVIPMSSLRLGVPFVDNVTQASGAQALGGLTWAWTAEGAGIVPSAPAFGRVTMEARKAAGLLQNVPDELADDAAGALGSFFGSAAARGYDWFEDDFFLNGTGVGEPQGLINAPCAVATSRGTPGAVGFLDVVSMYKSLHPHSKQRATIPGAYGATWLLSATAMDQILELYYNPSGSEVVPPSGWFSAGDGDQVGASMIGVPLVVTDHQPALGTAGDVVLADLSYYVIADRLEMTVERSRLGRSFQANASDFRLKARLDGRYLIQSPTTTEAAQSVSPIVVLH